MLSTTPDTKDQDLNEWLYGSPDSGPGPVYVLKSSKDFTDWWPKFVALQTELREAALKVWARLHCVGWFKEAKTGHTVVELNLRLA